MERSDWQAVLAAVTPPALDYLESLPTRRVHPTGSHDEIRAALDHGLTDAGLDPAQVVADLARELLGDGDSRRRRV